MSAQIFALRGGVAMIALGMISFIPLFSRAPETYPYLTVTTSYGLFLGLFPMNILNKLLLIAFGCAGVIASRARGTAATLMYCRAVFAVMGFLALLGMFSSTSTFFAYMPLFGWQFVAHAAFSLLGGYSGYVALANIPSGRPRGI